MDYEAEIKRLKASLSQTRKGAEVLVLCVAQALCQREAGFLDDLRKVLDQSQRMLENRGDFEASEMISALGRALVDPAFPSSEPP